MARYLLAAPYIEGCRVLDIACGTGYGLPVLRARASWVVGADVDLEAARKARAEIRNSREEVVVADGCLLPFRNESFDAVTSFETIEHLENRAKFLTELRRVLTPDGLCILSTPNAHHTAPVNGKPRNPHHMYEYTPQELNLELRKCFDRVELLGQALHARFTISPFWDDQQRLPRTAGTRTRLMFWRALNKLPSFLRNGLSYTVWGHPFLPTERDYNFSPSTVATAPVLVAMCRVNSSS
jgi:SAM-dependent methyltransferase